MKPNITSKDLNLKDIERQAVLAAINYTQGNVQFARELLGVSKATIYKLLKGYGIDYQALRGKQCQDLKA